MRRKVRNYPTKIEIENIFSEFFSSHKNEIIDYMLKESGYKDLDSLYQDEMCMKIGYCGIMWLKPKNKEQAHEWFLDNYRYPDYAAPRPFPYPTQIVDLQELQLKYALDKLNLSDQYNMKEQLL